MRKALTLALKSPSSIELHVHQKMVTNPALAFSLSAKWLYPANFASRAKDLNIKLATNAEPIWSEQSFQKIIASFVRPKSTAQTNSSRYGSFTFTTINVHGVPEQKPSQCFCHVFHKSWLILVNNGP